MTAGGECWEWPINPTNGYGRVTIDGRKVYAHRAIYELLVGPIPDELELDHLCRNLACVNPWHLEPVTHAKNVLRGRSGVLQLRLTHCRHGHEYTPENTYQSRKGRVCRACQADAQRRYLERVR